MMVDLEFEIDIELKEQAEKLFREKYEMTFEQACILFIEECIRCNGIPFEYTEFLKELG